MNRLEAGINQSIARVDNGTAQKILKAIQDDSVWTVDRSPTGVFCMFVDNLVLPVKTWNAFIMGTNNKRLIADYLLDCYE